MARMYKRSNTEEMIPALPRYHTVISSRDVVSMVQRNSNDPPRTNSSDTLHTDEGSSASNTSEKSVKPSTLPSALSRQRLKELLIGCVGIYAAYLYYGHVQEDLFRWRNVDNQGYSYVWFLQILESAVTICIGYLGRTRQQKMPLQPFFKAGASQLIAKVLMSLSLTAGLSFPVVTLAKSGKIVPVMLGQLILGGSTYDLRDYLFAVLIVSGTALVSMGSNTAHQASSDTVTGLCLITASLFTDGCTGGLQKRLKKTTASFHPNNFDFLLYSHISQFVIAVCLCCITGELWQAPQFIARNLDISWYLISSCICSCIGQCFIFYVIQKFDPLVCTTITTTRKMMTIVLSFVFKGHRLDKYGSLGLCLAGVALFLEVEGKYAKYRMNSNVKKIQSSSSQ